MARIGMLSLMGLTLSVLAACADSPAGRSNGAASPSPSPTERPMSQNPPPTGLPTGGTRGPSDQIKPLTVRGKVEAGPAPGCLELVTATSRFVMVGELSRQMRVGTEFEVTGLPVPQVRTACDGVVVQLHRVRAL